MTTLKLGDVSVTRVIEIDRSSFPTASMLPDSTADAIARHHDWLRPHFWDDRTGDLGSRIGTFIVRTPRHTVLIDTGVGNDKPRDGAPAWHLRRGSYLDDLAAAGVEPERVDFVLCTHLHVDHVGWNTRLSDHAVDPWLAFEPAPGHTPGHVCVRLTTRAGQAVFSGDLMHRTVQVAEPQWSSRFCYDPAKARDTRRAFVERHADTGVLVLAAHFPRAGYIVRRAGGFRFAPADAA